MDYIQTLRILQSRHLSLIVKDESGSVSNSFVEASCSVLHRRVEKGIEFAEESPLKKTRYQIFTLPQSDLSLRPQVSISEFALISSERLI